MKKLAITLGKQLETKESEVRRAANQKFGGGSGSQDIG